MPGPGEVAAFCIDPKGDDRMRLLICCQQEMSARVNCKVTRLSPASRSMTSIGQLAGILLNTKTNNTIVPTVGCIKKLSIWRNLYRRTKIFAREVIWQSRDSLQFFERSGLWII